MLIANRPGVELSSPRSWRIFDTAAVLDSVRTKPKKILQEQVV